MAICGSFCAKMGTYCHIVTHMGNPLHHKAVLDVLRDAPAPLTVEDIAVAAFITEDEVLNSLSVLVPARTVLKVATRYGDRYVINR